MKKHLLVALLLVFAVALEASAQDKPRQKKEDSTKLSLDSIFTGGEWAGEFPSVGPWWPKLDAYAEWEGGRGAGRDLVRYDLADAKKEVIASARRFTPDGERPLSIDQVSFSADGSKVLLATNSKRIWRRSFRADYWVYDLSNQELKKLGGHAPPSSLMNAQLSPDGHHVGYVRDNNLYTQDLRDLKITQLTKDGSETVLNGVFDWVYEEEFEITQGFHWSPNSKKIAFWQLDVREVKTFHLINNTATSYTKLTAIRYPKVGEKNPGVRIGMVGQTGGEIVWVKAESPENAEYIARMDWAANSSEVAIQVLNRLQNTNSVQFASERGTATEILKETDKAWVDVHGDLQWVEGGKRFLWLSEQDGWRHLYAVNRSGEKKQLTKGEFDVIHIDGYDESGGVVYFSASPKNVTQRYLYRVGLDGNQSARRVTPDNQVGTHTYRITPSGKYAVHTYSTFENPPVTQIVHLPDHKTVRVLTENKKLKDKLKSLNRPTSEFFQVQVDEGSNGKLDAWMIKPPDFDANKKYPILVHVYGEPAGQTVADHWGGRTQLWHMMLAQQGYLVMSIDNRGTAAPRGRAWRKSIYEQVGILASADQASALKKICEKRSYIDPQRVAIWGWSGGGSMTLNAMFRYPDRYQTGMSVAPVPNQRYYDTIYQERYMGLPSKNSEGYRKGSPITYAHQLKGNLLVVHGTGDDNCHYQGTEALIDELIAHNKQFTMMAYPNRSHGISEGTNTTRHLFTLLTKYLNQNCPPGAKQTTTAIQRPPANSIPPELAHKAMPRLLAGLGTIPGTSSNVLGRVSVEHAVGMLQSRDQKHREINMEGWKVSVDERLLTGQHEELGRKAQMLMVRQLQMIKLVVEPTRLRRLQQVRIWLDLNCGKLHPAQYHPSKQWLKEHGYPEALARCVHIPDAHDWCSTHFQHLQPWAMMHELAHAYHDQVLGFDNREVRTAWQRFKESKRYESILHLDGHRTRHYALTNPQEFFAEMTESYFGQNDFYPFNRAELQRDEPEVFKLLSKVWGPLPGRK